MQESEWKKLLRQSSAGKRRSKDGNAESSGAAIFEIEHDQRGRCGKDSWLQPTVAADDGAGAAGTAWFPGMLSDPAPGKNSANPVYAIPRIGGRRMKDFFKDYFRRFLIGAAVVVASAATVGLAILTAWLVVGDGDSPLFYLVVYGVILIIVPLIGTLAKI